MAGALGAEVDGLAGAAAAVAEDGACAAAGVVLSSWEIQGLFVCKAAARLYTSLNWQHSERPAKDRPQRGIACAG